MLHSYSSKNVFRALLGLGLSLGAVAASAQTVTPIAISGTAAYTQDFDNPGFGTAGTSYPAGWSGLRYARGTTATTTVNEVLAPVVVVDGSTSGAIYNAGANSGTDRALGTLASGSTTPAFGAAFVNNTGAAITQVNLAARLEQWRSGSNSVNETVVFEYSLNATNLESGTTSTWVPVTALDLVELATTSTAAGPLNGNDAANSRALSGSITGLNWAAGTTMWIRWRDNDDAGSDALLAIDNFSLSTGTTTGVRQSLNAGNVRVFPNPTADNLTIQVAGRAAKAAVTVTDLTGRTVLKGTSALDGSFSLNALRAGQYILLVQDGETLTSHKIVKQ